jgi:hypothetical protein
VYDGVALGPDGQVCADPMLVLWSQLAPQHGPYRHRREASDSDVYFGFVTSVDIVVRAGIVLGAEHRVRILDYTFGPDGLPLVLQGFAETHIAGGPHGIETLSMRVTPPLDAGGACGFASFDGTFLGVLRLELSRERVPRWQRPGGARSTIPISENGP